MSAPKDPGPLQGPLPGPLQGQLRGPLLGQLQRRFFALCAAPDGVAQALRRAALSERDLSAVVAGDERLDAIGRIEIYAGMYYHRLLDVLCADYPKLAAALGEGPFARLVTEYLDACPSENPSVRHLGARLPGFIDKHVLSDDRPWLGDLARLEWARVTVFDRADAAALTMDRVRGLAPEAFAGLPLPLIPAHQILAVGSGVDGLWRRLEAEQPAGTPDPGKRRLLVWRQDLVVYHRLLEEAEAGALAGLSAGITFGALCDQLSRDREPEEAARRAWELSSGWLTAGLIADTGYQG